jgi:hypothetical protein
MTAILNAKEIHKNHGSLSEKKINPSDCKAICLTIFNFPKDKIDSIIAELILKENYIRPNVCSCGW